MTIILWLVRYPYWMNGVLFVRKFTRTLFWRATLNERWMSGESRQRTLSESFDHPDGNNENKQQSPILRNTPMSSQIDIDFAWRTRPRLFYTTLYENKWNPAAISPNQSLLTKTYSFVVLTWILTCQQFCFLVISSDCTRGWSIET